jgi:ribosomal protein L12E/L44/L45/RPP1/RPP2
MGIPIQAAAAAAGAAAVAAVAAATAAAEETVQHEAQESSGLCNWGLFGRAKRSGC